MSDAIGPPRRKRLSWECRCEIVAKVRGGMSAERAAASSGVHRSTVYRLLARHEKGGWAGLRERRPVPHRQPRRCPAELEQRILAARAASRYGPRRLGAILEVPASTVHKVLSRHGASRIRRAGRPAVIRYERERPGELLHVDTKRLGCFWQSTTTPAWPTASYWPARAPRPPAPSCSGRWPGSPNGTASLSSGCSPTTATWS